MRGLARCLVLVLMATTLPAGRAGASTAGLVAQLDAILAARHGGDAGIYVADPAQPAPLYVRNADEPVIAASIYKLAVLAEAERRVDVGSLTYATVLTIEPEDVTEDGSYFVAGSELTLDEALEHMITLSDNGSALALWRTLGPQAINATLAAAGIRDFHIALDRTEDHVVTARAVGQWLTLLADRRLVSPAASDRMAARLARQRIRDRLPSQLPADAVVANKTGNLVGLTHDAGIVYTAAGPRVAVVLTWDMYEPEAVEIIGAVGAVVFAAVLEPATNASYALPRAPVYAEAGVTRDIAVRVTNIGRAAWTAGGPGSYSLLWELRDPTSALVASGRASLPAIAPTASAEVRLAVPMPAAPADHRLVVGLADSAGRALAAQGAAVGSVVVRVHRPFVVSVNVEIPTLLHRAEAHLIVARYAALPAAGQGVHSITLAWRARDARTGVIAATGTTLLGNVLPGRPTGTFFARFTAPAVRGSYMLEYELREGGTIASEIKTQRVEIVAARTYPDDRASAPAAVPLPMPTRRPAATSQSPARGRTPSPRPSPSAR